MKEQFQRLARRQLSKAMAEYLGPAKHARVPREGWVAAIREALGMSVRDLGKRMGLASSSVSRLEQREREGAITLAALRTAAAGLDCELVYALVPRTETLGRSGTDNLLDALIMKHARNAAAEDLERVGKTMALEDQAISPASLSTQVEERAALLAAEPRLLWPRIAKGRRVSSRRVR